MKTIMLTGAGGAAIPALIKRLRGDGYRVIAGDMDPYAVGLYIADRGFVIPAGNSSHFLESMRHICQAESVDVLVPLVDEELLSALGLEKDGIIVMLPRSKFVEMCLDKFLLMQRLKEAGVSTLHTCLVQNGSVDIPVPFIIKPRRGRGSRGVEVIDSPEKLGRYLATSTYKEDQLICQEFVSGPEYTVSVVVWRDGEVQTVVPKEIILKKGITRLAVTRHNSDIDKTCCLIQERLKADGPFNVQLRLRPDTGEPIPFEINPRFSTTITLTIASGIDELGGLIAQAIYGKDRYSFGQWKEGVVLLRQTADEFIDEASFRKREVVKI